MNTVKRADNSGKLFDHIREKKKLPRDTDLAKFIGEHNSIVSEIRHGKREINDNLLIRICDRTNMSLKTARALIAERD